MAGFPSEDCLVLPKELPSNIYRKLVILLIEGHAWKKIAEQFINIGIFSEDELMNLEQSQQPAERLLHELGCRLCDVGTLCALLEECQLYSALMLFKEREPPVITEHPVGFGAENSVMVERGRQLCLTCRASGLPPPTYQWYLDSDELPGCTSPILTIHNFDIQNEGDYYCMAIQKGYESVISNGVMVSLAPEHPIIEQQSRPQFVCRMGAALLISVRARGHPRLGYQWFKGSRQLDGFTRPDLPIDVVTDADEGDYRCYIYNSAGEVWSDPCHVTVFVAPEDINRQLPRPVASAKVALLIANQAYENMSRLGTPIEDVRTLANIFIQHDFQVIALQNLSLVEMRNAIKELCKILPKHAYVVFYFAGHGFEMKDKYMLPVSTPGPDFYLKKDAVSEEELLRDVLDTHPQVFLELLDMCLKSPETENKAIFQEVSVLHKYSANNNLIQGYATTSYLSAYERKTERNGLYVKFLKQYLMQDISMVSVLANVAKEMEKECVEQMPYRGTNVTKEFRLTDPCGPCDDVKRKVDALTKVPEIQVLRLDISGLESIVTCIPYHGIYCNALQVIFTNLHDYMVTCDTRSQQLQLRMDRQGKDLVITVMNLQRVTSSEELSLQLESRIGQPTEFAKWTLGKPMIAVADLWLDETECAGNDCG